MFVRKNTPTTSTPNQTARWAQEKGASLVEYALLVALIAVVCISAVAFLGTSTSKSTGDAGTAVQEGGADEPGKPEIDLHCPSGWHQVSDQWGPYCDLD